MSAKCEQLPAGEDGQVGNPVGHRSAISLATVQFGNDVVPGDHVKLEQDRFRSLA